MLSAGSRLSVTDDHAVQSRRNLRHSDEATMILYRPVGLEELCLIYQADMRAFPSLLPQQPDFCAVLGEQDATEVARRLSTETDSRAGFVTRFSLDDPATRDAEQRIVDDEFELPAEELDELNAHLADHIQVVATFFGEGYVGPVTDALALGGKNATEQFLALLAGVGDSGFYIASNLHRSGEAIFVNFFFWEQHDFTPQRIAPARRDRLLDDLKRVWSTGKPGVPLGIVR
jgi:hypothetical protein